MRGLLPGVAGLLGLGGVVGWSCVSSDVVPAKTDQGAIEGTVEFFNWPRTAILTLVKPSLKPTEATIALSIQASEPVAAMKMRVANALSLRRGVSGLQSNYTFTQPFAGRNGSLTVSPAPDHRGSILRVEITELGKFPPTWIPFLRSALTGTNVKMLLIGHGDAGSADPAVFLDVASPAPPSQVVTAAAKAGFRSYPANALKPYRPRASCKSGAWTMQVYVDEPGGSSLRPGEGHLFTFVWTGPGARY